MYRYSQWDICPTILYPIQPQTYTYIRAYIDSKARTYLLFYINQLPYMTVIVVVVV